MIDFTNAQIPPPKNWQDFENLCADLWRHIWNDPDTQKNGRGGQKQHGVDVYGRPNGGEHYEGVQCKGKDGRYGSRLTEKELKDEVENAKKFQPLITKFTIATTTQNDQEIQRLARAITEANRVEGRFDVVVFGWDEIIRRIAGYPEVIEVYYPQLGPTQRQIAGDLALTRASQIAEETRGEERHAEVIALIERKFAGLKQSVSGEEIGSNDPIDSFLNKDIDRCRSWIQNQKPLQALDLLEDLRDEYWNQSTARTRFRVVTNVAAAHLRLGKYSEAAAGYLEAVQYAPEDEKALCNVALAHLIRGDNHQALDAAKRAVDMHPEGGRAHSLVVAASIHDLNADNPETLVPERLWDTLDVAYAFARFYGKRGNTKKDREWMERAYALGGGDLEVRAGLAVAILADLSTDDAVSKGKALSEEQKSDAQRARDLLATAWDEVRKTEVAPQFAGNAFNLSSVEALLGFEDRALEIATEASALDPSNTMLKRQLALLRMNRREFTEAIAVLDTLPDEALPEKLLIQSDALRGAGRAKEALARIDSFLASRDSDEYLSAALESRVRLVRDLYGASAAAQEVSNLLATHPNDINLLIELAAIKRESGDEATANETLHQANSHLTATSTYYERMIVAEALFAHGLYEDAAKIYEGLVGAGGDSRAMRQLVLCLFETDKRAALSHALETLPEEARRKPFFLKLIGMFKRKIGEVEAARDAFEAYLEEFPNDLQIQLAWAEACHSLGDPDSVERFLSGPLDFPEARPQELMKLAHLLDTYKRREQAVSLAYETRRRFPNDPVSHLGYITLLFFGHPREGLLNVKTIGIDTAFVVSKPTGERQTFVIESGPNPSLFAGEISPQHPIARAALGAEVGHTVVISKTEYAIDQRTVVEIKHKYVHALHDSMEGFEQRFPGVKGFWKVPVGGKGSAEEDLQPILDSVSRQHEAILRLEEGYRSRNLPLALVARLAGLHPIDLWGDFLLRESVTLVCCSGTALERNQAFEILADNHDRYLVDPITLYSMCMLGIEDAVLAVTGGISVVQTTLDALDHLIEQRERFESGGVMTLWKEGEKFVRYEKTEEEVAHNIENLKKVRSWAAEHCSLIQPVPHADPSTEHAQLAEMMPPEFYDSLLAADGNDKILISDDMHLRSLGKETFGIEGIWLQPILMKAREDRLLTQERYAQTIDTLIGLRYSFISVDPDALFCLAQMDKWKATDRFMGVVGTIGYEACDLASSIRVAIGFLQRLWTGPVPRSSCSRYLAKLLGILIYRRWRWADGILDEVVRAVAIVAGGRLSDQRLYLMTIAEWCRGHFYPLPLSLR